MSDYEAAVEVRDAVVAVAERVDALNATATRIAVALEQLVRQHHAVSRATYGESYTMLLGETEPA